MPSSPKATQPWETLLPGRQGRLQGADTTHPGTLTSQASSSATFSSVNHGRGGPHLRWGQSTGGLRGGLSHGRGWEWESPLPTGRLTSSRP